MTKPHIEFVTKSAINLTDVAKVFQVLKNMNLDIGDPGRFGDVVQSAADESNCSHQCYQFKPGGGCPTVTCPHEGSACGTENCSPKTCKIHGCETVACVGLDCTDTYHNWGKKSSTLGALSEAMAKLPSESWSHVSCSTLSVNHREDRPM